MSIYLNYKLALARILAESSDPIAQQIAREALPRPRPGTTPKLHTCKVCYKKFKMGDGSSPSGIAYCSKDCKAMIYTRRVERRMLAVQLRLDGATFRVLGEEAKVSVDRARQLFFQGVWFLRHPNRKNHPLRQRLEQSSYAELLKPGRR